VGTQHKIILEPHHLVSNRALVLVAAVGVYVRCVILIVITVVLSFLEHRQGDTPPANFVIHRC